MYSYSAGDKAFWLIHDRSPKDPWDLTFNRPDPSPTETRSLQCWHQQMWGGSCSVPCRVAADLQSAAAVGCPLFSGHKLVVCSHGPGAEPGVTIINPHYITITTHLQPSIHPPPICNYWFNTNKPVAPMAVFQFGPRVAYCPVPSTIIILNHVSSPITNTPP